MNLSIIDFNPSYTKDFHDLNIEWLEHFFYVEDFDKEVLSKPETYIIKRGGHIFFALNEGRVLGTVALIPTEKTGVLELTKMAVLPEARGQQIGQSLLQHCIDFSRAHAYSALMLYSNTKLENAIHLYRKYGFIEIKLEDDNPYDRANIKMLLKL